MIEESAVKTCERGHPLQYPIVMIKGTLARHKEGVCPYCPEDRERYRTLKERERRICADLRKIYLPDDLSDLPTSEELTLLKDAKPYPIEVKEYRSVEQGEKENKPQPLYIETIRESQEERDPGWFIETAEAMSREGKYIAMMFALGLIVALMIWKAWLG